MNNQHLGYLSGHQIEKIVTLEVSLRSFRIHNIAQAIPDHVKGQDDDEDGNPRGNREPRQVEKLIDAIPDHPAPTWRVLRVRSMRAVAKIDFFSELGETSRYNALSDNWS